MHIGNVAPDLTRLICSRLAFFIGRDLVMGQGDAWSFPMAEKWHDLAAQAFSEIEGGSAEIAVGLCEQVLFQVSEQYGESSREAFRWRGWKGKALVAARRFVEAEELFGKLLEDQWVTLGPDDEETLSTRGNLADAIARAGRPIEAISALQLLLADRIRLFGPDAKVVLTTIGKIAHTYHIAGNNAESVRLYEELLSRQSDLLGSDHSDVFVTENNLIIVKSKANSDDSLSQLELFVNDCMHELGPEDLFLLTQQHHLASAYYEVDRFEDALSLLELVVEIRTRVLGPLDQRTIISMDLRALCKLALGDFDSAVMELRGSLELWRAIGMENDQIALQTQANLVDALLSVYAEDMSDREDFTDELSRRIAQIVEGLAKSEPDHQLKVWLTEVEDVYPELFPAG